ncbi:elongation of fatty acids protein 3-like [Quillaja saponaria]|uniref:very-long-chain 3-oxoacyl-CoA synthase n=1 Tax=Quillaja saponaria TaxID=32244 RepID=A0AAD7PUU9_QUISA|nr:elongation of fatty acids protein 3-like [Quillaja saponaria]
MNPITSFLQYWLVNHPTILKFSWTPGKTLGSSPLFLSLTVLSYLSLTFILSHLQLPPLRPHFLKSITTIHNLILLILSLIMAVGCTLTFLTHTPHLHWIICFPPQTPPTGPLFFWAYVFYFSKILEFIDTLLIILSNSTRRLTFLHVYHHATVVIMCYIWLQTSQSLFPIALVTNASVHVLMYGYYLLSAMGVRPKWKRIVTDCQIVQFVFSFAVSGLMLYYHLSGSGFGCSGIGGWCFNAVFNASLLALFVNFHMKNYANRKKQKGLKDKAS